MTSISGRILLYTLAGLAAGFLTWLFSDASGLVHLPDTVKSLTPEGVRAQYAVGMAFGAFIGILLGATDLLLSGSWGQWPKALGFGLVVGLISGVLGLQIGMLLFGALYVEPAATPFDFLRDVLARAIGWAAIGAMAGTADGWRKGSLRVGRNGLIGGLIGGVLGGSAFEIIPYLMPGLRASPISRLFGFLITGACIGLFISLVQQLFKEAWIRVVLGRNEGKEYLIEKVETKIGRSELADVPLFGDAAVAKIHALLIGQPGDRFLIRDVSNTPGGVVVNGARLSGDQPVRDGDQIQIANRLLVFREKLTRERTAPAPRDLPARPSPPSPFPDSGRPIPNGRTVATRLVATSGPNAGASFALSPGISLTIGRDSAASIPLPADTKASRNHARISSSGGGGWIIEDLGSTNGTFVNGQRITRLDLAPGDVVMVGTTAFRFE